MEQRETHAARRQRPAGPAHAQVIRAFGRVLDRLAAGSRRQDQGAVSFPLRAPSRGEREKTITTAV